MARWLRVTRRSLHSLSPIPYQREIHERYVRDGV